MRVSLPMEFCVRDNGPGVPEELLPHLFDPFVTTKPTGSGLGLALVAKIVGDHGGIVECESQPRHTNFRVLFPVYAGEGATPDEMDNAAAAAAGKKSTNGEGNRAPAAVSDLADASLQPRQRTMKGGRGK
jgi:two-component system nitrogen regulation sensor histidine kinase GlnL